MFRKKKSVIGSIKYNEVWKEEIDWVVVVLSRKISIIVNLDIFYIEEIFLYCTERWQQHDRQLLVFEQGLNICQKGEKIREKSAYKEVEITAPATEGSSSMWVARKMMERGGIECRVGYLRGYQSQT